MCTLGCKKERKRSFPLKIGLEAFVSEREHRPLRVGVASCEGNTCWVGISLGKFSPGVGAER